MIKIKKHHIKYIFSAILAISVILILIYAKNLMYIFVVYSRPGIDSKAVFYGRVIDQYGQPVLNAEVNYSRGEFGTTTTNSNGDFIVKGIGKLLTITSINHDSIDFHHNPKDAYRSNAQQEPIANSLDFYRSKPENSELLSYLSTTINSPHIFKAWRVTEITPNINIYNGQLSEGMISDGRIYTINLKQGRGTLKEGGRHGQLKVSCKRKLLKSKRERREHNDWEFTLEAIDGGIQGTDDYYLNTAPNTGYKKNITVKYFSSSNNYKHYFNKRYYFKSNKGSVVGAFFLAFKPFARMKLCGLALELYKYNTQGSHNLTIMKHITSDYGVKH